MASAGVAELFEFLLEWRPIVAVGLSFRFLLGPQRRDQPRFVPGGRMLEQRPHRLQPFAHLPRRSERKR